MVPSTDEIKRFKTRPKREEEERNLYQIISTGTDISLISLKATEDVLANIMGKKLDKILRRQDGILTKTIDEKQLEKIL